MLAVVYCRCGVAEHRQVEAVTYVIMLITVVFASRKLSRIKLLAISHAKNPILLQSIINNSLQDFMERRRDISKCTRLVVHNGKVLEVDE